ncbi:hypothetical protein PS639_01449 [Pseudomonas fluorescens]|nr:hypothetical protein PS639_01449 [Pseudomonas fluorescens]
MICRSEACPRRGPRDHLDPEATHRLVHPVDLTNALSDAAQALASLIGDADAAFALALAVDHDADRFPGTHLQFLNQTNSHTSREPDEAFLF